MVLFEKRKRLRPRRPESSKRRGNTLNTVDYEALAQFRYRLRLFLAFSDMKAKNAGITSQQYQALLAVKGFSSQTPMVVGELSRLLLIKHHTTVELVDRMVKLGLLQRTVDVHDRRRVLVTLTKRGQLLLQRVAAIHFKHLGSSSRMLRKVSKLLGSV
ncbi:MarR family winged helix-turn-helix transcriptional regulator [Bradyrhizobium australiense]|uniref:MarR family transcriptional regulator n=1 Tax=Bradyrhizobium australiense TaxID=2721161 RepID=A0A7Y4GXS1_9BRAD|nr:MarR family transcriptional regulator [Bradyrhizobium australiense]NOJ43609.1 MarR family transcriptional regulator [Bradyrhizobium australiense]